MDNFQLGKYKRELEKKRQIASFLDVLQENCSDENVTTQRLLTTILGKIILESFVCVN